MRCIQTIALHALVTAQHCAEVYVRGKTDLFQSPDICPGLSSLEREIFTPEIFWRSLGLSLQNSKSTPDISGVHIRWIYPAYIYTLDISGVHNLFFRVADCPGYHRQGRPIRRYDIMENSSIWLKFSQCCPSWYFFKFPKMIFHK